LVERQRVLLEIVRLAERLEVKFAFPTQTVEVERLPELFHPRSSVPPTRHVQKNA
jgi:MscS family membrane protein